MKSCKNCIYYEPDGKIRNTIRGQEKSGQCRRNPPIHVENLGWSFAFTGELGWCGEFMDLETDVN